jgi:hypothetical protein
VATVDDVGPDQKGIWPGQAHSGGSEQRRTILRPVHFVGNRGQLSAQSVTGRLLWHRRVLREGIVKGYYWKVLLKDVVERYCWKVLYLRHIEDQRYAIHACRQELAYIGPKGILIHCIKEMAGRHISDRPHAPNSLHRRETLTPSLIG